VPSVFNGDFEYGTRQSLLNRILPDAEKFRFPISYELPGWSFHGGDGFKLAFPSVGELDVAGLFTMETSVQALASGAVKAIWDKIADATVGALANKAKLDTLGRKPKAPDDNSSAGYRAWWEANWSEDSPNNILMDASSKFYDFVAGKLNELVQAGFGAFNLADAIKIEDKKINPFGADAFKAYISSALEVLFKQMFGSGSNYALLMGASTVIEDSLKFLLGDVAGEFWAGVLDNVFKFDTITHNRLVVPTDMPLLSFNVMAPVMLTPASKIKVRFLATELDPGLADSPWQDVNLDISFFSKINYSVLVPEEFKGKTAKLQFKFEEMEGIGEVKFDDLGDLFEDPIPILGQVFFLDDIRFSKGIEATVTTPIDEQESATLTVNWVPANPVLGSTITIDWRDGSPIETVTLDPGVRSLSRSHLYQDDDPTGTPSDRKSIIVTGTNVVGADRTTALLEVRNVKPSIAGLELSVEEIEEGAELRLHGSFLDPGIRDTFTLTIDWGDAEGPQEYNDVMGTAPDGYGTFTKFYRYADDNPTLTPRDRYTIKVTLEDDDGGKDERTVQVWVKNVAPVIDDAQLSVTQVQEGDEARLTVRYSDRGTADELKLIVDWPDGVTEEHVLAVDPQGQGSITIGHVLRDDNPTGTPQDTKPVKIRLEDDDGGSTTRELDLEVLNQDPTVSALFLEPLIDENEIATLQVEIDDPGVDDTFRVFVDWGDGGAEEEFVGVSGTQTFTHQYLDDTPSQGGVGTRNVTVRVVDDDTGEATIQTAVAVQNVDPTGLIGPDIAVEFGVPFVLVGNHEDPGTLDTHVYTWTIVDSAGGLIAQSNERAPEVAIFGLGTYTALLTVEDDDGGVSEPVAQQILVFGGVNWDLTLEPESGEEGAAIAAIVEVVGVPDASLYTLRIDFGDGTILSGVAVPASDASGKTVMRFNHFYADDRPPGEPDEYQVEATLYFNLAPFQGEIGAKAATAEVVNVAPTVTIGVTQPAAAGGAHQFVASIVDPGSDMHSILWEFSDGTRISNQTVVSRVLGSPQTVQLTVIDDDGGLGAASVFVPVPLAAQSAGAGGADALTVAEVGPLAYQAGSLWLLAGADIAPLDDVEVSVVDLSGTLLALVSLEGDGVRLLLDVDAAGNGWFVDATPMLHEEFATVLSPEARLATAGAAVGRVDLLTVLAHEFGHVLGLSHVETSTSPYSVMLDSLPLGMRRLPVTDDLTRALGGSIINGSFSIADPAFYEYGWQSSGTASIVDGEGRLDEDAFRASRLSQAFRLPPGAQRLEFVLSGGQMIAADGVPPDAFEVALLDPVTLQPLVGTIGLSETDAYFNLQANGSFFQGAGVTVTDLAGNPLSSIDFSQPVRVAVDVSALAEGTQAALYFDLLGFAALDSSVRIDDVRIVGPVTVNLPPVARADSATVMEDGFVLVDVLANDSDPDGDALAIIGVGAPVHGTAVVEAGRIRYQPDVDFAGTDAFTYTVTDTFGNQATATVAVTVEGVNDAPSIPPVADYAVVDGVRFTLEIPASDVEGDPLTFTLDQAPPGATIDPVTGRIEWTATGVGTDVPFVVTVRDGEAQTSVTFRVTVLPTGGGNRSPLAANDTVSLDQNSSVLVDVLANDLDPDGDALTVLEAGMAAHGTVVLEDGLIRYTPSIGYVGADSFTYVVGDGRGGSASATVEVAVRDAVLPNRPPIAEDDAMTVTEDGTVLIDVLGNDTDPDGDALEIVSVSAPLHGTAVLEDNRIRYTPSVNYHGTDELVYVVRDGRGGEDTARVAINVTPVNDLPVARDDSASVAEDGTVLIDVLANDSDVDGDALILVGVGTPAHGTAVIENGRIRYTPNADYHGPDSFTYEVRDAADAAATATVRVTVNPVNDLPTLAPVADARVGNRFAFSVRLEASDADGDALTFVLLDGPAGAVLDATTGLLTWTASGPGQTWSFTVAVRDGRGGEAARTFRVQVRPDPVLAPLFFEPLPAPTPNQFLFLSEPLRPLDRVESVADVDRQVDYGFQALPGVPGLLMPTVTGSSGRVPEHVTLREGLKPFAVRQPLGRDARFLLWVEQFVPTLTGFAVRFNDRIERVAGPDMRADGATASPEVMVTGPDGRLVAGTIVLDADGRGFRFDAAEPVLDPGAYRVVLQSGLDGFHSFFGNLDGDRDGVPGGDYEHDFVIPGAQADRGPQSAPVDDAPRIDLGQVFTGFGLAAGMAFGGAARGPAAARVPGATGNQGEPAGRHWQARLLAGGDPPEEIPNRSILIRLDD
jgi:hypothetical protein